MLDSLILLRELVEAQDVAKACPTCDHWREGQCCLAEATPPPEVQKVGCEEWEFFETPF